MYCCICTLYWGRICCHDVLHQLGERCSCEGWLAGRAFVHDAAQRPQVTGSALRRILKQLWRHVGRRCPLCLPRRVQLSDSKQQKRHRLQVDK